MKYQFNGSPQKRDELKTIKAKDIIELIKSKPNMAILFDREYYVWKFSNGQYLNSSEARKVLDKGILKQVNIGNGSMCDIYRINL